VNLIYGSDTFRSVCICIFFCVNTHYSSCMRWHRINLVFWWNLCFFAKTMLSLLSYNRTTWY
jgi:hypothetical protein